MKIAIIAPHIDDEIYSCSSVISRSKNQNHDLNIFYFSTGVRQLKRKECLNFLFKEVYDFNPKTYFMDAFVDGESQFTGLNVLTSLTDKIFETHDTVFFPSISDHQDHISLNKACNASLRYRSALKNLKHAYEYEYMYNHDNVASEYFIPMNRDDMNKKIEALAIIDSHDPILDPENMSVNSIRYVEAWAIINGSRSNNSYAESFKVRLNK